MNDDDSIAGFIFDLDGTLLDSLAGIANTANEILSDAHFPTHPIEAYRWFIGEGVEMLFRNALGKQVDDSQTIQACVARFHEVYDRQWKAGTTIYDGIADMLTQLAAREIPFGVLSNKPHRNTVTCVEQLLANWQFSAVFGQRVEVPRKPDPAGAIEIAQIMSTPVNRIAFVGDSTADMMTGKNAGMLSVGVGWGFGEIETLTQAGAKVIVNSPSELLGLT